MHSCLMKWVNLFASTHKAIKHFKTCLYFKPCFVNESSLHVPNVLEATVAFHWASSRMTTFMVISGKWCSISFGFEL